MELMLPTLYKCFDSLSHVYTQVHHFSGELHSVLGTQAECSRVCGQGLTQMPCSLRPNTVLVYVLPIFKLSCLFSCFNWRVLNPFGCQSLSWKYLAAEASPSCSSLNSISIFCKVESCNPTPSPFFCFHASSLGIVPTERASPSQRFYRFVFS